MITLTHEKLHEIGKNGVGFNSAQLTVLGCENSECGWLKRLVGRQVDEQTWALLVELRGASAAKQKKLVPDRRGFFSRANTPDKKREMILACREQFKMLLLCLKAGERCAAEDHARKIAELCRSHQ